MDDRAASDHRDEPCGERDRERGRRSAPGCETVRGDAVEELVDVLRDPGVRHSIPDTDRANRAKYLTISKLKLENVIAMVRSDDPGT